MKRSLGKPARKLAPSVAMAGLSILALAAWPVAAQLTAPSTGPGQATDSTNPSPASNPTTSATSPATGPTTAKASLNFKDAPISTVLDYLSEVSGYVIIPDVPIDGRVTVISKRPVNPVEAVSLLRTVLANKGFTVIQDGRELRIIAREKAKKADIPVHYGADPEAIDATDDLITQVIPIVNMDAVKLRQDLTPLIGTEADVTANESSNAIVITDTSANIRRVVRVISALDKREAASSDLRIVQLHYAPAAATAKLLESIFKGAEGGAMSPQQMQQMMMQGGGQGGQPQGRSERSGRIPGNGLDQALHGGHVNAVADERTNSLIITAPTDTLKFIDGILKDLDSNPEPAYELKAVPLKYADADATAKLLNSTFKPDDSGGGRNLFMMMYYGMSAPEAQHEHINITADSRTNSLIVSAPAEAMKQIDKLVRELDANPASTSEMKIFSLKHADAFDAALLIKDIFPTDKDNSGNSLRSLLFGGSPASSAPRGAKVSATSDDRTNTLIVTAPSELMKGIGDLVSQLDVNPASEDTLFIYRLKNGQATNLETVLNSLFGNINQPGAPPPNQGRLNGQQQGLNGQNGQNAEGQQAFANGGQGGQAGGGNRSNQRNGQANGAGGAKARLSPGSAKATSELTGKVFVVADTDTNSLLVTTAVKYEEKVRQIISELDRPVPQVMIKVLIAEVTHDRSDDLGLDYSILNVRANGNGTTLAQNLGNAASAVTNGGLSVAVVESNITATLHALALQNKLDVLSRPYILTSDNQEANILVGNSIPLVADTRITETGQTINTLQYRDIGIILDVTPHINPDGLVILDVYPEVSQLTGQTVPITQGSAAPVIAKRTAQSRVGIADGQTIVIGGLMQDQVTQTITKVPILGDLPFVGPAFTRYQNDKTKTELLFFLTPHVAQVPDSLREMTSNELRGTKLTPNAVSPGLFQDHIRGMQRGALPFTQPATQPATEPTTSPATPDVKPTSMTIPVPPNAVSVPPD